MTVLLMLGLAALGHGALLLSLRELESTWAYRNLLRAQAAAELGLHLASRIPPEPEAARPLWRVIPLAEGETEDGLRYTVERRWLSSEVYLLESHGGLRGWKGERVVRWIGRQARSVPQQNP
jgi:hypothetical protein